MTRLLPFVALLLATPAVAAPVPKVVLSVEQEKEFNDLWDATTHTGSSTSVHLYCRLITQPDAAVEYHRNLTNRINQRYTDIVRAWESKIVERVGRSDDQTLQLARELDRLQRTGHDAERLLKRAASRKPLPDDHPTAALAYRIRTQLTPRRAAPAEPHPSRSAPSQGPGLGW